MNIFNQKDFLTILPRCYFYGSHIFVYLHVRIYLYRYGTLITFSIYRNCNIVIKTFLVHSNYQNQKVTTRNSIAKNKEYHELKS